MNTQQKELTEAQLQAQCFQLSWNKYPQTRRKLFHIPNGGKRTKRQAMEFKATGVIPGVPDLCFLWKGRAYFFELKTSSGYLSKSQQQVISAFEEEHIFVTIIRSLESFEEILLNIINS